MLDKRYYSNFLAIIIIIISINSCSPLLTPPQMNSYYRKQLNKKFERTTMAELSYNDVIPITNNSERIETVQVETINDGSQKVIIISFKDSTTPLKIVINIIKDEAVNNN